jgi:acetoin utilization deacetylase AcuC-like enzyme
MTTHLYTNDIFTQHFTPEGHPERPDRIRAVKKALSDPRFDNLVRFETEMTEENVFAYAHPQEHIDAMRAAVPEEGLAKLDADTTASPRTWDCVRHAVGGGLAAVDAVLTGEADNAFLAARPPGHHAEKTTAMGFCVLNTAAIMARHAQKEHGLERVAIVDFDVHHGNGTQDIFFDDATVFFASTHQMPLYPGTGAKHETGVGNICNAPLAPQDGSQQFREAMRERVLCELDAFAPEFIIISAGFDAHVRDPLANINLADDDFDWITGKLMDAAERHCDSKVVSLLEGGYDLEGLAGACSAHVARLMDG